MKKDLRRVYRMAKFEPAFEYNGEGKLIAFKCQECGQRLKPVTKHHGQYECDWYKNYSSFTRRRS